MISLPAGSKYGACRAKWITYVAPREWEHGWIGSSQWKNPQTSRPLAEPNNMQNVEQRHKKTKSLDQAPFFETESDRFQADTWKCTGNAWFWRQAWEAPQTESIWVYKTEPHRVRLARNMAATVTEWAWMCGLLLLDFMRQIFWINQLMGAHWSIDPLYVHGFPRYIHLFWLSQIKRSSPRPTGNRQRQLSSTR